MAKKSRDDAQRKALVDIADSTLRALDRGSYIQEEAGEIYLTESIIRCVENTRLYAPDSVLANWASPQTARSLNGPSGQSTPDNVSMKERERGCKTIILQISTLAGARLLANTTARDRNGRPNPQAIELEREDNKIGVLNFASAKEPGGGFQNGAQAQEESLVRSSTVYPSLVSSIAEPFYTLHRHDPRAGYYSHAMIYSPNVLLIRDDEGRWQRPVCVDMLTAPAVNTRVVKQSLMGLLAARSETAKAERVMRERAARALYAFERHGIKHLVLGAWGCGVFGNDVRVIAGIWADLLGREDGRFAKSFERVVFAVLGQEMFRDFEQAFEERAQAEAKYVSSTSIHSV